MYVHMMMVTMMMMMVTRMMVICVLVWVKLHHHHIVKDYILSWLIPITTVGYQLFLHLYGKCLSMG